MRNIHAEFRVYEKLWPFINECKDFAEIFNFYHDDVTIINKNINKYITGIIYDELKLKIRCKKFMQ